LQWLGNCCNRSRWFLIDFDTQIYIYSKSTVSLSSRKTSVSLAQKVYIKWFPNFNFSISLNSSYWNIMWYKNLGCFEFIKSLFLIFKIMYKHWIYYYYFWSWFLKIEKSDLETSKLLKILFPIRFQYEKFNKIEKSKFEDHLIYFLS
jgi:hypothetical protein